MTPLVFQKHAPAINTAHVRRVRDILTLRPETCCCL